MHEDPGAHHVQRHQDADWKRHLGLGACTGTTTTVSWTASTDAHHLTVKPSTTLPPTRSSQAAHANSGVHQARDASCSVFTQRCRSEVNVGVVNVTRLEWCSNLPRANRSRRVRRSSVVVSVFEGRCAGAPGGGFIMSGRHPAGVLLVAPKDRGTSARQRMRRQPQGLTERER